MVLRRKELSGTQTEKPLRNLTERTDAIRPYGAGATGGQIWLPSLNASPVGRRGEAQLRTKFFAKLSFKKAGEKAGRPPYII